MLNFFLYFTYILFLIVCILLVLLVLIQKGRGGGLSGAFGGGGGNTAFGSKTGDVLTWATSILFGVFLILAIAFNLIANKYDQRAIAARGGAAAQTQQQSPVIPGTSMPKVPPGSSDPGRLPNPGK